LVVIGNRQWAICHVDVIDKQRVFYVGEISQDQSCFFTFKCRKIYRYVFPFV
jgi:hypothetical protein